MGRKVSVALEADVAGFVRPVEMAKKSVDDLGDKVDKLDRELDKIPPDAAKAGAAMKLLGGEADAAGKKIGDIGDRRTNLALLDSKIRNTRAEVRKLADEFTRTGDVDVFKKLGDSQGRLGALTKIRKEVADDITGGIEDGMIKAAASPQLRQVAISVGAAFAVPLLAAVGGALTGAVGFGVAGAGLAGAFLGDPERYGYAWSQTLHQLKADVVDASAPFKNELYSVIAGIGPLVQSWHLDRVLGDAAKYVQPLVTGVEGFATNIVRGVGVLVNKGEPAVHALSESMLILGSASESALTSIANGAEGGADALRDVASGAGLVIRLFGGITQAAEKAYGYIHDHPLLTAIPTFGGSVLLSFLSNANGLTSELRQTEFGAAEAAMKAGAAFSAQGDNLSVLTQQLNAATLSADTLAGAYVNKVFTATMSLDQAFLGVAQSLTHVTETLKENHHQLDIHSAKGQADREVILGAVTANMQLYQAQIAAGMSAEDAAKQYGDNTAALEAQLKKAHLTQAEIDGLIGKYRDIPNKVDTDIAVNGLTSAINGLSDLIKQINGIHDKTVTIYYRTQGQSLNAPLAHGGVRHAAAGMIVPPSNPGTLIGEPQTGGEVLTPLRGISRSRAMDLTRVVGNSYGFNVGGEARSMTVNLAITGHGTGFTRLLAQTLQDMQRNGQLQLTAS